MIVGRGGWAGELMGMVGRSSALHPEYKKIKFYL